MKILANDGISQTGITALEKEGFEVLTTTVAQEQLINFINDNKVIGLLVRSATKVRKDIIDSCSSLKLIGRGGVGLDPRRRPPARTWNNIGPQEGRIFFKSRATGG